MESKTRQPGYYRVKYKGQWALALYGKGPNKGDWELFSEVERFNCLDEDFDEIDPTPIDPNPATDSELQIRVRSLTNALVHIAGAPFLDVESVRSFANKFLSDIPVDPNPAPQSNEKCPVCDSDRYVNFTSDGGGKQCMDCGAESKNSVPTQPAGQLTAEEVYLINEDIVCDSDLGKTHLTRQSALDAMKQYATSHTAAKDAEIAKLREELERWKGRTNFYREASDRYEVTIQEQDARIKDLEKQLAKEIADSQQAYTEMEQDRDEIKAALNDTYLGARRDNELLDEAVKLLRELKHINPLVHFPKNKIISFLDRIDWQAPPIS